MNPALPLCCSRLTDVYKRQLSPNAIRQQLVVLERDGLVVEQSVRRGPTKPTHEFSLTNDGEKLFPHHYDKMLGAVLREVRAQHGETGIAALFEGISKRTVAKDNPEVCSVIHQVLAETIGGTHVQTESLATGGSECKFELKA